MVMLTLAAVEQSGCRRPDDDVAARDELRRRFAEAIADAWDRQAARDEHQDPELPTAPKPPLSAPPAQPEPATVAPTPTPDAAGASPMDQARACLRSSSDMNDGNACVVNALHGRATTESEVGLLCTTYRTMGRTDDAVRCMRNYIQRFPSGARVSSFASYSARD